MQSVNCLVNWHGFDSKFCMAGLGADDLENISIIIKNKIEELKK